MSTLADVIRVGVAAARSVLSSGEMLAPITHYPYSSQNAYGEAIYGTPVTRYGVVSTSNEVVRDPVRGDVVARMSITFMEDFAITARDKLVLSDGSTAPILRVDLGVIDASSGNFYIHVLVE